MLDAKEFDAEKESRKRKRLIMGVTVVVIILLLGWWFRFWREEHIVGKFFDALQKQDFQTAYGIWQHDAQWNQHPDSKSVHDYPFKDFYRDWGPGGEWGTIKTVKVNGASTCPGPSSGVLVDVIVNDRSQHAQVWVEKSNHTLSYPPCELVFQ